MATEHPTACMLMAARDLHDHFVVEYFFNVFWLTIHKSVDVQDIVSETTECLEPQNLRDKISKYENYRYLHQPIALKPEMLDFLNRLDYGTLHNGFPIKDILRIVLIHGIASRILLQNLLSSWGPIFQSPDLSLFSTMDHFIETHIDQVMSTSGLFQKATLFAHLDMINNMIGMC